MICMENVYEEDPEFDEFCDMVIESLERAKSEVMKAART